MHRAATLALATLVTVSLLAVPVLGQTNGTAARPASDAPPQPGSADDPCAGIWADYNARLDAFHKEREQRFHDFQARQEAARQEFSAHNHSEAEWQEFDARQESERMRFEESERSGFHEWEARNRAAAEAECEAAFQSRQQHDGPGDMPAECRNMTPEQHEELEAKIRHFDDRHRQFQSEYDAARRGYASSDHTPDEWRQFSEKWEGQARVLFEEMQGAIRAWFAEQGLAACADHMGFAGQPMPAQTQPAYDEHLPAYRMDPATEAKMREIEDRCRARMDELHREWEAQHGYPTRPKPAYPAGGPEPTYRSTSTTETKDPDFGTQSTGSDSGGGGNGTTGTAASSPPPYDAPPGSDGPMYGEPARPADHPDDAQWREFEERMRAIQRECEAEMRALFESVQGEDLDQFGSLKMYWDESSQRIVVEGKHLKLYGLPEAQMMVDIAVGGATWIDELYVNGYLADFRPQETDTGTALVVTDEDGRRILGLHDNPRGVVNMATSDAVASITLDLADHLTLERMGEGVLFTDGTVKGKVLSHGGTIEVASGNVLTVQGKATFVVAAGSDLADATKQAALDGRIGAEVAIAPAKEAKDGIVSDSTPYGDLEVEVEQVDDGKVEALIDSEQGEGKTVVLKFDRQLFDTIDLKVSATDIADDGTESDMTVREAESLEDVLDPLDDGEAVEYWIVQDKYGVQVLASIPHFSLKKISVEGDSPAEDIVSWVPAPGVVALVTLVAAAALGSRRLKDDE